MSKKNIQTPKENVSVKDAEFLARHNLTPEDLKLKSEEDKESKEKTETK